MQSRITTSIRMLCSDYVRLRQDYEAAVRRWARLELWIEENRDGFDAAVRLAVKQKAFEERNAAYVRIALHERNCRSCTPKQRVGYSNGLV